MAAAARAGHLALCKLLVERGASLNGTSDSSTPLKAAVGVNREAVVRFLLESGADPNLPKDESARPLLLALTQERDAIAKILLESGADPAINSTEKVTEDYRMIISPRGNVGTPLHEALFRKDLKMANLLLDHNADVNARIYTTHITPLHLAAAIGDKALIERLLKAGAKVDAKTNQVTIRQRQDISKKKN